MGVRTLTRMLRGRHGTRGRFLGSKSDYVEALGLAIKRARRHERGEYRERDMDDELSDFVIACDDEMEALDKYLDRTGDAQ